MWAKVSSAAPHLLRKGLLVSPIKWRCLLRVLCSARRPVTTLDCVLLKDKRMVLVARLGNVVNSWACLWVLLRPHHLAKCWLSIWHFIFLPIFCPETCKDGSGPTNFWIELSLASLSAISFPHTPACPWTQYSLTVCWVEISLNSFWHYHTNGDVVLAAWRAFRATWLLEQILTYFSCLTFNWISL